MCELRRRTLPTRITRTHVLTQKASMGGDAVGLYRSALLWWCLGGGAKSAIGDGGRGEGGRRYGNSRSDGGKLKEQFVVSAHLLRRAATLQGEGGKCGHGHGKKL